MRLIDAEDLISFGFSESDHFSDRIANGLMAQAAEIILKYHEMNKAFYGGEQK